MYIIRLGNWVCRTSHVLQTPSGGGWGTLLLSLMLITFESYYLSQMGQQ